MFFSRQKPFFFFFFRNKTEFKSFVLNARLPLVIAIAGLHQGGG